MADYKIIYLTSWYNEKNPERKAELMKCVHNVLSMGEVDKVYLLDESDDFEDENFSFGEAPSIAKLATIVIDRRPTYNDFFRLAQKVSNAGDIVIIANTDIYPEIGTRLHLESLKMNDCFALSRYDESENGEKVFFDRWDSQDVWILKAPFKVINADFGLGVAACDNAIAHRLQQAGYTLRNPSKTVRFNHIHNSGIRTYNPDIKIPKPYLLITPHTLSEPANYNFMY